MPSTEWMSTPSPDRPMPRESSIATVRSVTSVVSRITGLCSNLSSFANQLDASLGPAHSSAAEDGRPQDRRAEGVDQEQHSRKRNWEQPRGLRWVEPDLVPFQPTLSYSVIDTAMSRSSPWAVAVHQAMLALIHACLPASAWPYRPVSDRQPSGDQPYPPRPCIQVAAALLKTACRRPSTPAGAGHACIA